MRLSIYIVWFLTIASLRVLLHHDINSRWPSLLNLSFILEVKQLSMLKNGHILVTACHGSDQKDIINKKNTLCGQLKK